VSTPATYRLYGVNLRSPLALPCPHGSPRAHPDVRLVRGTPAEFARARAEAAVTPARSTWFHHGRLADGSTYVGWTGLFEFLVSSNGRRILYRRLGHATRESFGVYLLGQVLSFSLLALGLEPLHGTVVEVEGEAIVFLGDCGYGKSTLGAALLARGFPVVSDDLTVIERAGDDGWAVHPGVPRLKLFPGVARALLGFEANGTPMHSGTSKIVLSLSGAQVNRRRLPLRALYALSDPDDGCRRHTRVDVEPLSGRTAFLEVIRASFNPLVVDSHRLANQFAFATRVVSGVPVRRLTYRRDLDVLPAVCNAVLTDLGRCRLSRRH
jgi:hypothetical protein